MRREIILTKDGSHTIAVPELNVAYHSIHGAITESMHVYIEAGYNHLISLFPGQPVNILDIGFGTGLNVLLTVIESEESENSIYYVAVEPYPLSYAQVASLNYCELLNRPDLKEEFLNIHKGGWNKSLPVTDNMLLHKSSHHLQSFEHKTKFNLVYYDAFAPTAQLEMWTQEVFEKMHSLLSPGGLLVTYCSKGDVRRAMLAAGFSVEKIPGPPGKREMLRATRSV